RRQDASVLGQTRLTILANGPVTAARHEFKEEGAQMVDYSIYQDVIVEKKNKVMTITLNAPESLNSLTAGMHTTIPQIWQDVNDDPEVHVVVLAGAGRGFSAGGNVVNMQKKIDDPDLWDAGMPEAKRIVFRMLECDKPIIARLNGHAVGLGATVA